MKTGTVVKETVRNAAKPNGHMPPSARTKQVSASATPVPPKPAKAKKVKMVRSSLAIPQPEYALVGEMKLRAASLAAPIKKKMLIRAGIAALAAMSDTAFLRAIRSFSSHQDGRAGKAG